MKAILTLSVLAITLMGCANPRDTRMAEGAAIGGAGGAIIGGVTTGTGGGAVVGGVIGATAGALVADATRPRHRGAHCYYSDIQGRRICRYR